MSDFYSVLRQSMIDRDLRTPEQRAAAYAQARNAMIGQLWAYDPPLAEDEIDARIGWFDTAVTRIEDDLRQVFANDAPAPPPAAARRQRENRLPPAGGPPQPPPSYADDDGDDPWAEMGSKPAPVAPSMEERSRQIEAVLRSGSPDEPATRATAGRSVASETGPARLPDPATYYPTPDDAPAAPEPYEPSEPYERRRQPLPHRSEEDDDTFQQNYDDYVAPLNYDEPYPPPKAQLPPSEGRPMPTRDAHARRPGPRRPTPGDDRTQVRLLIAVIVVLTIILIGLSVYVFSPLVVGSASGGSAVDLMATASAGDAPRVVQIETPVQSYVLFDGRDPTVFVADSENPIRFEADPAGGFARVGTSPTSSGARAVIGPGLATRLAGRTIRVSVAARSARENGASSLRFAYQSGVAVSHWQSASLSPDFSELGLDWRLPALRTSQANDYIIIEPGVPGDGTSVDIRAITIEVLG